jgi:hypothetical protein
MPDREVEGTKQAIIGGLAPYRRHNGSHKLENLYHYAIARA